jgi:hypothetical protein
MQGRRPVPWFDPAWYRAHNQDVVEQGFEPLTHYHFYGRMERRLTCAEWTQMLRQRRISALGLGQPITRTKLALGILTYNNPVQEVERCLSSVRIAIEQLGPACETIVLMLDNGEPRTVDPSLTVMLRKLEPIGNIGFGAGHNRLMSAAFADATVDYYLTVNPDGAFEPNALKALVEMGQACGGNALIEALQFPAEHPKHYDPAEFDTAWASGASLMIPRRVYDAIGGFDESFFMYCEDVDLSWRARAAGFGVKTCPRALFFHPPDEGPCDRVTRARVLLSGITLARKWGRGRVCIEAAG